MCDSQPATDVIGTPAYNPYRESVIFVTIFLGCASHLSTDSSSDHIGMESQVAEEDTSAPQNPSRKGRGLARGTARAVGNVLLGIAIGLISYYGITDVVAAMEQTRLQEQLAELGLSEALPPDRTVEPAPNPFEEWEEEDFAFWEELEDGGVFGRLVAPAMELDTAIVKGHSRDNLKRGPVWVSYTDYPGPTGNVGISGHRTTYGAPFFRLNELQLGDTVDVFSPFRQYRYEVIDVFRVTPEYTEVLQTTDLPHLTMTACDPPYSAQYRLIVQSKLVGVALLDGDEGE